MSTKRQSSKMITKRFWAIFHPPSDDEYYRFKYVVSQNDGKPDSQNDVKTEGYSKSPIYIYRFTPLPKYTDSTGISGKSGPCLIRGRFNILPDRDYTFKLVAYYGSGHNKREIEITDKHKHVVDWTTEGAGDELEIPCANNVPIIKIETEEKSKTLATKKDSKGKGLTVEQPKGKVTIESWLDKTPYVTINDIYVNSNNIEHKEKSAEYNSLVPNRWEIDLSKVIPSNKEFFTTQKPRIEVVARSGAYTASALLKYKAKPTDVYNNNWGLAGFTQDGESISIPEAPSMEQWKSDCQFSISIENDAIFTKTNKKPRLGEMYLNGTGMSGSSDSRRAKLIPKIADTPKVITLPPGNENEYRNRKVYCWMISYKSDPILPLYLGTKPSRSYTKNKQDRRIALLYPRVGYGFSVYFPSESGDYASKMAHMAGGSSMQRAVAGIVESSKSTSRNDGENGRKTFLMCHTWRDEKPVLVQEEYWGRLFARAYCEDPKERLIRIKCGNKSIEFLCLNPGRGFISESLYIKKYGCDKYHPVRVWRDGNHPRGENGEIIYPEPDIAITRGKESSFSNKYQIADKCISEKNVLKDSFRLAFELYQIGHDMGTRLGHPNTSKMAVFFDGWPGLAPHFSIDGLNVSYPKIEKKEKIEYTIDEALGLKIDLSLPFPLYIPQKTNLDIPDHANLTSGEDILKAEKPMEAWKKQIGRYSSQVNSQIEYYLGGYKGAKGVKGLDGINLQKKAQIRQQSWDPITPLLAWWQIVKYIQENPDCETVILGGYSIGTNRALWLANALHGRFDIFIPESKALNKLKSQGFTYKPYAVNTYNIYDFLPKGRRICVNHLVFMDFNWGSATFLPYSKNFKLPDNVHQVHHIMTVGKMKSGLLHYRRGNVESKTLEDIRKLVDPYIPDILEEKIFNETEEDKNRRRRLFANHPNRLFDIYNQSHNFPKDIVQHSRYLAYTYEKKLQGFEEGKAVIETQGLIYTFRELMNDLRMLINILSMLEKFGLDFGRNELFEKFNRQFDKNAPIEDILVTTGDILSELGKWVDKYKIAIAACLLYLLVFHEIDLWGAIKGLVVRLYNRKDTQMMLTFSEDGVAQSSGAGFIFKTTGINGSGLINNCCGYQFVDIDHLQLGRGEKFIAAKVLLCLLGFAGKIRN